MFPIINYGAYFTDLLIEQSTLIAYEFDESRNIKGDEMYLMAINPAEDNVLIYDISSTLNGSFQPVVKDIVSKYKKGTI